MKLDLFNYARPDQRLDAAASGVILQGLSSAERDTFVGFTERLHYPAQATILRAGEPVLAISIVQSGRVGGSVMVRGRPLPVAPMGPGSVFGELGFFDQGLASATLWAESDVELLALPHTAFDTLAAWHPRIARVLLLDLGRVLAGRLRRAESIL
jgi:CRP-like cAMP-binding protein